LFVEGYLYVEPTFNAPAGFRQRIGDLMMLEAQTIRWEKTRKTKKKYLRDIL